MPHFRSVSSIPGLRPLWLALLSLAALVPDAARAAAGGPIELLRWDVATVGRQATVVPAEAWDETISLERPSGLLALGPGLTRPAKESPKTFIMSLADVTVPHTSSVEEAIALGHYLSIALKVEQGRRIGLTRLDITLSMSNHLMKLALVSNRTGFTQARRLQPAGLPGPDILQPDLMWKGGTTYSVDLAALPELQNLGPGEAVEFRLIPYALENRYVHWCLSSLKGPALVIFGREEAAGR
jgi:hypothetical protein